MSGPQKTYWHLLENRKVPTTYEISTSRLHYYVGRGFEVEVPAGEWYRKHQAGSLLQASDWERFADPRTLSYTRYNELRSRGETFVSGLMEQAECEGYDARLPADWLEVLDGALLPFRYPGHGMQMLACYVGQMAPASRVSIAAMFQAADEMRRVQWIAYRMALLRRTHPALGDGAKERWERDAAWQPLRETIERLLVTWDWGECFAALNLVLKPHIDELFMRGLAVLARKSGDYVLQGLVLALADDCDWHREWAAALARVLIEDRPQNRTVLQGWVDLWHPRVLASVQALKPVFGDGDGLAMERRSYGRFLATASLAEPGSGGGEP